MLFYIQLCNRIWLAGRKSNWTHINTEHGLIFKTPRDPDSDDQLLCVFVENSTLEHELISESCSVKHHVVCSTENLGN